MPTSRYFLGVDAAASTSLRLRALFAEASLGPVWDAQLQALVGTDVFIRSRCDRAGRDSGKECHADQPGPN